MATMQSIVKQIVIVGLFAVAFLSWATASATPGDQRGIMAIAGASGGAGILLSLFWDKFVLLWDIIKHKEK